MKVLVLIANTFRELIAKATLVILLAISTLIIIGTLLSFSSEKTDAGVALLMFGNPVTQPVPEEELTQAIQGVQVGLVGGLFFGIIIFGVFATAGIIPDVLEKGAVDLYLSKPIARWQLLLGRYLGAVVVVMLNITYFIGAIWLIFGIRVGVWNEQFLLSTFTLTFQFACLFSLVAFLGVLSRGAAIPILGAFLYLFVVGGLLHSREHGLYMISGNSVYHTILDGLFYIFPQITGVQESATKQIMHQPMDWKPFAQSAVSAGCFLAGAAIILHKKDF